MPSEQTKCILHMLSESIEDLEGMNKDLLELTYRVVKQRTLAVQQKLEATLFLLQDEVYGPSIAKLDEMEKKDSE